MASSDGGSNRGRRLHSARAAAALAAALALAMTGLVSAGLANPRAASAAEPTLQPITPGVHVYDYGNLLSPKAEATAEALATKIEASGGGRVVVYTADLMALPDERELASAWSVDGLLLTGWEVMGTATLGSGDPATTAFFNGRSDDGETVRYWPVASGWA